MAALVQGGLTRSLIPKLGERRAALLGLGVSVLSLISYGLATQGWVIYVIIFCGAFGGLATPAVQGIVSQRLGPDEQGAVQGALTSLASISGILGPPLATGLFGYFIGPNTPVTLPGAPFFGSALLAATAWGMAWRAFRKVPVRKPSGPSETATS
jgi:DHA1 family tetracycline resistance protein-like MFS transporter